MKREGQSLLRTGREGTHVVEKQFDGVQRLRSGRLGGSRRGGVVAEEEQPVALELGGERHC